MIRKDEKVFFFFFFFLREKKKRKRVSWSCCYIKGKLGEYYTRERSQKNARMFEQEEERKQKRIAEKRMRKEKSFFFLSILRIHSSCRFIFITTT